MNKRTISIYTCFTGAALLALTLNFTSCKPRNANKVEDSKDIAEKFNDAKFDDSKEAQFLVDATELCYDEIELARLAQSNGTNDNIKEIGKMMEKDNTDFLNEIKKLAETKDITIPSEITSKGQKDRKKLADDQGTDFDKNYCDMIVENHKKAIKKYMDAVEDCEDVEVKNWANKSLAILRNHLDHAMTCAEAYKETKNNNNKNVNKELDNNLKEVKKEHPAAKTSTPVTNKTNAKGDVKKDKNGKEGDGNNNEEKKDNK
jgi:putative membrane protein